jgi:chaperone protein PapD
MDRRDMMKEMKKVVTVACLLGMVQMSAQAAVGLDRTRAVFNGNSKSISLNISNDNKQLPYLAQTWLEDADQKKLEQGPLVVTPPVQRLEPGGKSVLRVTATSGAKLLAQDRESLFYFNLREIPPRSEKPNVLQIALQTKIKLFYRPAALVVEPGTVWQDRLVLHSEGNGYRVENPTPYYITLIGIGGTKAEAEKGAFDAVMLAPRSSLQLKSGRYPSPYVTYINDYGGRPTLQFTCAGARCVAKKA